MIDGIRNPPRLSDKELTRRRIRPPITTPIRATKIGWTDITAVTSDIGPNEYATVIKYIPSRLKNSIKIKKLHSFIFPTEM